MYFKQAKFDARIFLNAFRHIRRLLKKRVQISDIFQSRVQILRKSQIRGLKTRFLAKKAKTTARF